MNNIDNEFKIVRNEIENIKYNVTNSKSFLQCLQDATRIFVDGKGRSGLVVQMFSNRLVQLGKNTHVIGEVTCPAVKKDDLYLIVSGSGTDNGNLSVIKYIKQIGAKVAFITANKQSPIISLSDFYILISTDTKFTENKQSVQPMGALFEQASLLILESVVLRLQISMHLTESDMEKKHANVE